MQNFYYGNLKLIWIGLKFCQYVSQTFAISCVTFGGNSSVCPKNTNSYANVDSYDNGIKV